MVVFQGMEPRRQCLQGHAHLGHAPVPGHGSGKVLHCSERRDQAGVSPGHSPVGVVLGVGRLCVTGPQVSFFLKKKCFHDILYFISDVLISMARLM